MFQECAVQHVHENKTPHHIYLTGKDKTHTDSHWTAAFFSPSVSIKVWWRKRKEFTLFFHALKITGCCASLGRHLILCKRLMPHLVCSLPLPRASGRWPFTPGFSLRGFDHVNKKSIRMHAFLTQGAALASLKLRRDYSSPLLLNVQFCIMDINKGLWWINGFMHLHQHKYQCQYSMLLVIWPTHNILHV